MASPIRPLSLIAKGIRNPRKVPPYVLKQLFPQKYSPKKVEDGVVTWNTNVGFDWGDGNTPPQIAAINYHLVQALRKDLQGREYRHAVEIGCGYGRVTPWLSEFADKVTGVDPNKSVLSIVDDYYPGVGSINSIAQKMPIKKESADLVFTRSVLQHISPEEIKNVADEIKRITSEDADILICEGVEGEQGETYYPRTHSEYEQLFKPFKLQDVWRRKTPAKERFHTRDRLFFSK